MIIVGAGLAGLTAGLRLQADGHQVTIVDRLAEPGGLCGTRIIDGHEFAIGCNDFGSGIVRHLRSLGVPIEFKPVRTVFHFAHGVVEIPVRLRQFVRHTGDIVRFARALRGDGTLGPVLRDRIRHAGFADFLGSLAYGLGVIPDDLPLAEIRASFSKANAYGYDRPVVPVGGPGALTRAMARRFTDLGGELLLSTEADGDALARVPAGGIPCFQNPTRHRQSEGGSGANGPFTPPGLAIGMYHLLAPGLEFPPGVHTLAWLPKGVDRWLTSLNAGEQPPEFGFHLFASDLPERPINIFLYLPRGADTAAEDYIFDRAERMLPGLRKAITYRRYVSPTEYTELHGLSSAPQGHAGSAVHRGLAQACQVTESSSRVPNRTR